MPDGLPRASHNKKTVGSRQLDKKNSIGSPEDRHFGEK